MKKKAKIILTIISIIVILIISYVILVIKGILPNLFLDTSDLVCFRDESDPEIDLFEQSTMIFSFDKKAIIKSYKEETKKSYLTEEIADKSYQAIEKNNNTSVTKNGKDLIIVYDYKIEENKGYYGNSKKQIKEMFEKEFNYVCE